MKKTMNAEREAMNGQAEVQHAGRAWIAGTRSIVLGLACCSALAVSRPSLGADAPAALNYQGILLDGQGHAASAGVYRVEFRIWDDPSDKGTSDLIWGRAFPLNVVDGGLFNVLLTDAGDEVTDPAPQTNDLRQAFADEERYLGLTVTETPAGAVSGPNEIPTREQLVGAPFAFFAVRATDAEQASDGFRVENGLLVESGGIAVAGPTRIHENLEATGTAAIGNSLQVQDALTGLGTADFLGLHVHGGAAQFGSGISAAGNVTVASPASLAGYGTVPIGGIVMWNGPTNAIPSGWAICDGRTNNGHVTPDLLDRFLAGAGDDYSVGSTGGEETHVLALEEMPEHSHRYAYRNDIHGYHGTERDDRGFWKQAKLEGTGDTGGGGAHENRPPYYAVYFIMRVQ